MTIGLTGTDIGTEVTPSGIGVAGIDDWRMNAEMALDAFRSIDDGRQGVHAYAWTAQTIALLYGWHHPDVAVYLDRVYAQQNPDGGYGIEAAWDAFQDGTINPRTTTYAITLTDHVGPVLLDGWRHGVVPASRVQEIVDLVVTFPTVDVPVGRCVAYSTTPSDRLACVDNINASAAQFLAQAQAAGFTVNDPTLIGDILSYEHSTVLQPTWWPYQSAFPTLPQDWQHNATVIEAMLLLDPLLGSAGLSAMAAAVAPSRFDRLALLRLAPFDCSLRTGLGDDFMHELGGADALHLAILANLAARASMCAAS